MNEKKRQTTTEVEIRLRTNCKKWKVVEPQKLNGAHMIFTKESGLAIRVYNAEDLKRMDDNLVDEKPTTPEGVYRWLEKLHNGGGRGGGGISGTQAASSSHPDDVDGLAAFRKYFQYAFVFCLLPTAERNSYLDRPDSILHRIQRVMCSSNENTYQSVSLPLVACVCVCVCVLEEMLAA